MRDPEVVYKYLPCRFGLSNLRDDRLKITPVREANDPSEFPVVFAMNPPSNRHFRRVARDKKFLRRLFDGTGSKSSWGDFRKFESMTRIERAALIRDIFPSIVEGANERFAERTALSGIISCSAVLCETLLWSHYGDGHRGVAIGVDRTKWGDNSVDLQPVVYAAYPAPIDFGSYVSDSIKASANALLTLTRTKVPEWQYEQEYRTVCHLPDCESVVGENGALLYFAHVPPEKVKEVVFGAKCTAQDRDAFREILKHPRFAHVLMREILIEGPTLHPSKLLK